MWTLHSLIVMCEKLNYYFSRVVVYITIFNDFFAHAHIECSLLEVTIANWEITDPCPLWLGSSHAISASGFLWQSGVKLSITPIPVQSPFNLTHENKMTYANIYTT